MPGAYPKTGVNVVPESSEDNKCPKTERYISESDTHSNTRGTRRVSGINHAMGTKIREGYSKTAGERESV
jgi:hypothetical protein